jgi:3-(methylsulfanyl)propanoyl-CoA dehydrogenase
MYRAPLRDIEFVLQELLGATPLAGCRDFPDYSADLAHTVLEEAARFAETVLEPLNKTGDREGAHWSAAGVAMPAGFKEAYRQFVEGGWPQLGSSPEYGGEAVPQMLATAVQEIWSAANLSFELCPMLTHGAAHALALTGSAAQRQLYLPKMVSGEWTGTMVLTEPQAGSDLGLVRTRAVPEGDHHRLFGQKIFITFGEHDYTPNIVHMVLARVEGAPAGTRGISLFIVPKMLVQPDGSLGERNDVRCVSIEHKLGIHASPTCVMAFGEREGAVGYLVGEANRGLEYMFIMMNTARLGVGLQGCAMAERALQQAAEWARTRVQGKPLETRAGSKAAGGLATAAGAGAPTNAAAAASDPAAIIHHPDVKRMLLTMQAGVEAMRARRLCGLPARSRRTSRRGERAERRAGAGGPAHPDREGLVHRAWNRDRLDGHPGPRGHGLHRGDRRGAVPARRAHHGDLRGNDGHPGERPDRTQDRPRWRRRHEATAGRYARGARRTRG